MLKNGLVTYAGAYLQAKLGGQTDESAHLLQEIFG